MGLLPGGLSRGVVVRTRDGLVTSPSSMVLHGGGKDANYFVQMIKIINTKK